MLDLLSFIGNTVAAIGTLVWYGVVEALNGLFAAVTVAIAAAFALLPSMNDAPVIPSTIGGEPWLGWLNWFYPVGDLLDGLSALVTMFIAFLAVRYVLRLVRAL